MATIEEYLEGKEGKDKKSSPEQEKSRTGWMCIVVSLFSLVLSGGLWYAIARSVSLSEASLWLAPVLTLVSFVAAINLAVILLGRLIWALPLFSGVFFSVLIFAPGKIAAVGALAALLLMLVAARRMRQDIEGSIRLNLWKTWRSARFLTILALAIVVGTQYFHLIGRYGAEKVVPQVGPNDLLTEYVIKAVNFFNPELVLAGNDNKTIDELILSSLENSKESKLLPGGIKNLSPAQRQQILGEGRKQFAKFLGREVKGDERASVLMSEMINRKIENFYKVEYPGGSFAAYVPSIFALAAFLTVLSIGPVLVPLGGLMALILFKLLVRTGAVRVAHKTVEQEVIA